MAYFSEDRYRIFDGESSREPHAVWVCSHPVEAPVDMEYRYCNSLSVFRPSFLEKRACILLEYRPHHVTYRRQA